MADAFLKIVQENLSSLIKDEIGMIIGAEKEMKKLFSTFTTIQAVLEDAEVKKEKNKGIQNWLCKLKDLVFEIDDILDECATQVSKLKHKNAKLSLKKVLFRFKIAKKIKKVSEKLDVVADERLKYLLHENSAVERSKEVDLTRVTSSILNESEQIYGREEDKEKIVDIMVNGVRENRHISVLPIIGVGGLGKTTLAKMVYNDQRVVHHFEKRLWVCVSDNFDQETLVRAMIESATGSGSASDLRQLDTLERRLYELLKEKKYLLVLDDVWNEYQEKWRVLKNILSCGSNGTCVIVTTRLKLVADIMGTHAAHSLEGLSEENCWKLLRERAFEEEEKEKYPNLEAIGREIVKKCAGVPMAAKALGGILRFKRTEKEWTYVKESELWNLQEEDLFILPALRLSYHHLPLELRQCFAYFAIFPKDHKIEKKELIRLWMGHGYISSRGILEVEDVGDQILNELLLRSLIQYDPFLIDYIVMHDLVHDLAQSMMENKVVQGERQVGSTSTCTKIREVNLRKNLMTFPPCTIHDMDLSSILTKYSRLRVLQGWIQDLPSTVGNLKHLRFLNLAHSEIRTLPNSLCTLWNLHIIDLTWCSKLEALPRNTRHLKNLCHLFNSGCTSLRGMPPKIGELTCLQTLSLFIVGSERGNQLEELQHLNLRGELEIKHLERVGSHMDAKKANLCEKKELRDLSLEWESNNSTPESRADIEEKVLEALQPHPNLRYLTLRGFRGRCFPVWMSVSVLRNLVRMDITECRYCLHLPEDLGKLPHLEYLSLEKVGVEYIIEDENAGLFPSLKTLRLYRLRSLKGLSKEEASTRVFPNLATLYFDSCSSITLPQLSSLQELEIDNCDALVLHPSAKLEALETLRLYRLRSLKGLSKEEASTRVFLNLATLYIDSCSSITLPQLSSLKYLEIRNSDALVLHSSATLEALTCLQLSFGENMKSVPVETLQKLINLKELRVVRAEEESLPEGGVQALKSLTKFYIDGSETLRCLPVGWLRHLSALKFLHLSNCPELIKLPEEIKELENLKTLELHRVDKMVCLPNALRHLSSLKHLTISELPQLNALPHWLEDLISLHSIYIQECPKLVSLPPTLQGMLNLQSLDIKDCPQLERRCKRGSGEDWPYISHIPHIRINLVNI